MFVSVDFCNTYPYFKCERLFVYVYKMQTIYVIMHLCFNAVCAGSRSRSHGIYNTILKYKFWNDIFQGTFSSDKHLSTKLDNHFCFVVSGSKS